MEEKKVYLRLNREQLENIIDSMSTIKNNKDYEIIDVELFDDLLNQLTNIYHKNYTYKD